jgi:hypothetical protein
MGFALGPDQDGFFLGNGHNQEGKYHQREGRHLKHLAGTEGSHP